MKLFLKTVVLIIVLALIADIVASFYIYNQAISRSKKTFMTQYAAESQPVLSNISLKYGETPDEGTDWFNGQPYNEFTITSDDNLKLKAYYLPAKYPTDKTVILAHGYSSQGTFMGAYAKFYYEQLGYNVLLPDARGHGKSEGQSIGFGWIDRKDYLRWINFIIKNQEKSQIVLHGVSMGADTVLMTSGEKLPDNVKAVISDCAYTSLKDELSYQFKQMYTLPAFPIISSASILTKVKAGYFLGEASALKQVNKSVTPTLFIHGSSDSFVPTNMVYELYNACSSSKELWVVPNAGHGYSYFIDCDAYVKKVKGFLDKYMKEK
jgi:fermentation-respiration switch protein FrsA (DUF1100 family)